MIAFWEGGKQLKTKQQTTKEKNPKNTPLLKYSLHYDPLIYETNVSGGNYLTQDLNKMQ